MGLSCPLFSQTLLQGAQDTSFAPNPNQPYPGAETWLYSHYTFVPPYFTWKVKKKSLPSGWEAHFELDTVVYDSSVTSGSFFLPDQDSSLSRVVFHTTANPGTGIVQINYKDLDSQWVNLVLTYICTIAGPVANDESIQSGSWQLFPNPGQGQLYLRKEGEWVAPRGTYALRDANGRLLRSGDLAARLDFQDLPGGILFLTIHEGMEIQTVRFVSMGSD